MAYTPQDKKLPSLQPIVGVVTEQSIAEFGVTDGGSKNLRVSIRCSGVTVVGSIAAKLQMAVTSNDTYVDLAGANASVSITADGIVHLRQNIEVAADQPNMPLLKHLRVVLTTTNAGDEITIDNVYLLQQL